MERFFNSQLDEIKKVILSMGGHVEKALDVAAESLLNSKVEDLAKVHDIERLINAEQIQIDNLCLSYLAKQGPVAKDLRVILSMIKMNTDLERMGDQCVNIAYTAKDYLGRKSSHSLKSIKEMCAIAKKMVFESLQALVHGNIDMAKNVLSSDDQLDLLKNQVFQDMIQNMKSHPQNIEASLDLILIARNLERMGDHATNIAEDVIFISTGKDIRHGGING